jgi:hypothetical protein
MDDPRWLLHRLHLKDPVAGDDLLGFAEGAVDHGALAGGELDPDALGAPMERGEVQEHTGVRQPLVVLAPLGQEFLAGQVAGFPDSLIIIITRTSCLLPVDLARTPTGCEPKLYQGVGLG